MPPASKGSPTAAVALPAVTLTAGVPDSAVVLALPTRPAGDVGGAVLVAEGPTTVLDSPGGPPGDGLRGLLRRRSATGKPGDVVVVPLPGDGPRERLLLVGTGDASLPALRKAGAAAARKARDAASLALDLRGLDVGPQQLGALAEAALLASYGFGTQSEADGSGGTQSEADGPRALQSIVLAVGDPAALAPALDRAVTLARATAKARDLVNMPSLTKTPAWLAEQAQGLLAGLDVRVRDERELAAEGFGGIVGVGIGSTRPPRLIEATYDGGGDRHVVLVGKGITFDTGGLSLKPNDGMQTMKTDMGGGAAVLCALRAVADLRLPLKVTALVAAAENMPSGTAQRPGDVLTQYGGRTVEVLNTDAEGRLVLADALAYADLVLEPDVLVDVATLTGAMPVALGRRHAGLFASDDVLAAQLEQASADSGEQLWRMPLVADYRSALDSPTADLRNIGNPRRKLQGGSITAALFLREFTGGRAWAHLDIAGTAWSGAEEDELVKGATGYGVRLLVSWLEGVAGQRQPVPAAGVPATGSAADVGAASADPR